MKTTTIKRDIDGILLLNKPQGLSSNAALQRAKHLFNARKAGHSGSLDPLATGMLPLCFGEATKFSQFLLDADKVYQASGLLGIKTDTSDSLGTILTAVQDVTVNETSLQTALSKFRGKTAQTPSMYSALKHHGQPLYRYARQGIEIARKPRIIDVHKLELLAFDGRHFTILVHCSKGTYIRNLIEDIGDFLKVGAHMTALHRKSCAGFNEDAMLGIEDMQAMPLQQREQHLLAMDTAIYHFPSIEFEPYQVKCIMQGRSLEGVGTSKDTLYRLYDHSKTFLGIGVAPVSGILKPQRLVANYSLK